MESCRSIALTATRSPIDMVPSFTLLRASKSITAKPTLKITVCPTFKIPTEYVAFIERFCNFAKKLSNVDNSIGSEVNNFTAFHPTHVVYSAVKKGKKRFKQANINNNYDRKTKHKTKNVNTS